MKMKKFAVIGGDKRSVALAEKLFWEGHSVEMYGFINHNRELPMRCKCLREAIKDAEYIIGPTPCSHNRGALNAPFHNEALYVEEVFQLILPDQVFIAGYIKDEVFALAQEYGVQVIDMLQREDLLTLNAIPTAEGAIKIAIEETDITIHGSSVLVIGYGRIGTVLSRMLRGIGAKVFAVTDTPRASALARSAGHYVVPYQEMQAQLPHADIIFNTVPETVLDRSNMSYIREGALIIDLASPPYGVDVTAGRELGHKILFTNSLPGKIAPVTTAGYILDTIYQIILELEGSD